MVKRVVRKLSRINFLKVLPIIVILMLFYYPLTSMLKGISLTFIKEIFLSNYYKKIIFFTLYQATLSSLLSVIIAIPGAYIVTRYDFVGKKLFLSITALPFVLPSILTVLGFVILFGNNGFLNKFLMGIFKLETPPLRILYSLKAVLLAHIFYNFPLAIRIISSLWKKIPYELTEASYTLGYNRIMTFIKVTLPFLKSAILTSLTLIFLYCFMSFGIILVLGGGPNLSTVEVEVYRFARIALNLEKAASLALLESIVTITVLYLYLRSEKSYPTISSHRIFKRNFTIKSSAFFASYLIPLCLIIIAPLLAIVVSSFFKRRGMSAEIFPTLDWYKSIFGLLQNRYTTVAIDAIKNSFMLGFTVMFLTIPFALLICFNIRKQDIFSWLYKIIFFIPMGISSLIIGLSYLSISDISGSYIGIIFAHIFISLPIAIRSINNVQKTINQSLIEVSQTLGYNRFKTYIFIELPMLKSGIITAGIFTLALSIGEMNASIMLAPTGFTTIPLTIYKLISAYNFMGACALGSILLFLSLISFRLIDNMDY